MGGLQSLHWSEKEWTKESSFFISILLFHKGCLNFNFGRFSALHFLSFLKKKGSSTCLSEALDVATTRIESRILVFNRSDRSATITTRKHRAIRTLLLSPTWGLLLVFTPTGAHDLICFDSFDHISLKMLIPFLYQDSGFDHAWDPLALQLASRTHHPSMSA